MVLCFAGAWLTAEGERWRLLHVTLGYTMGGLVAFRVLWGLVGTHHARFKSFVRGPAAVGRYALNLVEGQAEHHVGHNPAGAVAIVGMLLLTAFSAGSGWAVFNDLGPELLEELHELSGNALMALVLVHVFGVIVASRLHRENLVRAMFSGWKQGPADEGIRRAWRGLAAVMLVAVLGFWAWQWQTAPAGGATLATEAGNGHGDEQDDD
ncbi:MAG: cytochrome b/b6 domain-containing protein [Rubrivivax sp.]|nr:cytochrome b/b6 domain-containing protein [Rubrivivax sp.]